MMDIKDIFVLRFINFFDKTLLDGGVATLANKSAVKKKMF